MLTLVRISDELPTGIELLAEQARSEGYNHVERLVAEWRKGIERFSDEGCVLLCGIAGDGSVQPEIVGIGGLTRNFDPSIDALRMRRFYVAPEHRRKGYGRIIATGLIQEAAAAGHHVVLHAGDDRAVRFWESLGFVPEDSKHHTHRLL
jgi:GNAT superfamily N-acetyltransferase